MIRSRHLLPALIALFQFGGCADRSVDTPALPAAPTLSLVERSVIETAPGNSDPFGWVIVGPDDEVYIGHPVSRQIAAFDASGALKGRIGGAGRAEGEFERMAHAGTIGDSLWVYDGLLRRVTVFDPTLDFARAFTWPPPADRLSLELSGDATVRYLLAITPEGRIVSSVYREQGWSLPDSIPELVIVDGVSERRPLVQSAVPPVISFGGGYELQAPRPFPMEPVFVPSSDGASFVFIESRVEGPDAGTFRVTRMNSAGDTLFSRNHRFYPIAIPDRIAEEAIEREVEGLRRQDERMPGLINAYRENVYIPPVYPPVLAAVPGRDGSTWIQMHPLVEGNVEYYLLDSDGDLGGRLSVPGPMEIVAGERARVWAVERGPNGEHRLVLYDVTESGLSVDGG